MYGGHNLRHSPFSRADGEGGLSGTITRDEAERRMDSLRKNKRQGIRLSQDCGDVQVSLMVLSPQDISQLGIFRTEPLNGSGFFVWPWNKFFQTLEVSNRWNP